uniref:NmrA-like domain-containing protein n=1 Tax=Dictyopteris divaricata TaxID=156996 RepID=A0A2I4Q2M3_9PHAE|nr:hypothetical protein [Dictyopteris divaricata]YP_010205382.1 hypothetical protein LK366_pgp009 [Grateloupia livida]AQZ25093.1 hypothetical protein [Dictyopteris divaricata]UAV85951.1 hypothetical protein [Grateloupia livida]
MTLLILGGTGMLGRQIVRKALENGFEVRCIVRNKTSANFLKEWGAELVYGDLTIPETLPLSFQGVTAVIDASTRNSTDSIELINIDWYGKLIMLELSKYIKVQRFIFLSILNCEHYPYISLMKMKYGIEKLLKNSTMPFTIFKYAGFFQTLINEYAVPILDQKPIRITSDLNRISYIDTQDAAFFCIKSLSIKKTRNKIFCTGSSQPWNSTEIISLCEKLSGQEANIQTVSALFLKILRGITGLFQWSLNISERLAFIEVLTNHKNFIPALEYTYKVLEINPKELLELDFYFREYFEIMLNMLDVVDNLNEGKLRNTKTSII